MTIFHVLKYGQIKNPFTTKINLPKEVINELTNWATNGGFDISSKEGHEIYRKMKKEHFRKLLLEYEGPL